MGYGIFLGWSYLGFSGSRPSNMPLNLSQTLDLRNVSFGHHLFLTFYAMLIPTSEELTRRKSFKAMATNAAKLESVISEVIHEQDLHVFYSSRVLLSIDAGIRCALFDRLLDKFPSKEHRLKIAYLKKGFASLEIYDAKAKSALEKACAEDVMQLFEHVLARIRHQRVGPDGYVYNDSILDSQYEHLASVFSDAIGFIRENRIPFSGRKSGHQFPKCHAIGSALSRRRSVWTEIVEVLYGAYVPKEPSYILEHYGGDGASTVSAKPCQYFLANNPEYWRRLEIYRDLNIGYQTHKDPPEEALLELMEASGLVKRSYNSSAAHIDLAKANDMSRELEFHNITLILDPIYGGIETEFRYQNNIYRVGDLIEMARKLSAAGERIETATENGNYKRLGKFFVLGLKALARQLDIQAPLQPLIELFSYDCNGNDDADPRYLPLVRNGKVYYLIPSLVMLQSYDKLIDKILSRRDVEVLFKQDGKKGLEFELSVEKIICEAGYRWGKTKRDQRKGIPEIDGAFLLDSDIVVLYEAKCSIKPEERSDAYSFVENHLVSAVSQLNERLTFLRTRPEDAASRLGFSLLGRRIVPIIVTNHAYFTGLIAKSADGDRISIIDYDLFTHIISLRKMPCWEFDSKQDSYIRSEVDLCTAAEIIDAMAMPWKFLKTVSPSIINVTEGGIGFEIAVTPNIDFLPPELKEIVSNNKEVPQ